MILLRILKWLKIENYSDPTYRCWGKEDRRESPAMQALREAAPAFRAGLTHINWDSVNEVTSRVMARAHPFYAGPGLVFSVDATPHLDYAIMDDPVSGITAGTSISELQERSNRRDQIMDLHRRGIISGHQALEDMRADAMVARIANIKP